MTAEAWDRVRLDRWPDWDSLRQRTRDLFGAMLRAVEDDRDRPRSRRRCVPEPTHNVLSAPSAQHRYEAGSEPDPASVLLGEAGVPGG